jgi:hypothetical protein
LEDLVSEIFKKFMEFVIKNKIKTDIEYISDLKLDYIIEDIINEVFSSEFDLRKEELVINNVKALFNNDEINDVILLTNRGKIIYTSLNDKKLTHFLKEIEFRVKICNNSILKMFYTSKMGELVLSEYINELYLLVLIFDSKVRFGMAEFYLHKMVKNIEAILTNNEV